MTAWVSATTRVLETIFPLSAMPAERCPALETSAPESSVIEAAASFAELGVPAALVDVLDADGITAPFPVQAATLPDALAGRDILGRARTGSGKTLGFAASPGQPAGRRVHRRARGRAAWCSCRPVS